MGWGGGEGPSAAHRRGRLRMPIDLHQAGWGGLCAVLRQASIDAKAFSEAPWSRAWMICLAPIIDRRATALGCLPLLPCRRPVSRGRPAGVRCRERVAAQAVEAIHALPLGLPAASSSGRASASTVLSTESITASRAGSLAAALYRNKASASTMSTSAIWPRMRSSQGLCCAPTITSTLASGRSRIAAAMLAAMRRLRVSQPAAYMRP
jgi:hypothetical protein